MSQAKVKSAAEILQAVYKNLKMAQDSLLTLMPKATDEALKKDMTVQLSTLEAFASRTCKLLAKEGTDPAEEGIFTRMSARWGSMMHTVKDSSSTRLAEMLVEGYTMGVNDLLEQQRAVKACECVDEEISKLVRDVCEYQEQLISEMKEYLL